MKPYLDLWTCRKLGVKKLTRESLEDWQLSRIRETFQWAVGRSPFYAELYQGMKADTWEDFRQLPFTSPADVCARGLEMVCVSQSEISRIVTMQTSGTTGVPKRIYFTEEDQELTTDFFHNGMQLMADASRHGDDSDALQETGVHRRSSETGSGTFWREGRCLWTSRRK